VTIYNTGSNYPGAGGSFGGITLSGNGSFSLSAATSSANGAYPGVVIYQARANTRALALGGSAASGIQGTVYAPSAPVVLTGNVQLSGALVAGTLNLTGSVALMQTAVGNDGTGDTAGMADTLLAGNLDVYLNDPAGYFTADERARIQDAIAGFDALLAPYNVTITQVSDPSLANIVLDSGTTSACGGRANGVLGCYNGAAGEITLIQGWDWYAGADPGGIGPAQYDFQTTVTHELGHALGLGGSGSPTSPMNETLPAGTARRTATAADLNIPEAPVGADPLTAAGFPVVSEAGRDGQAWASETPVSTGRAAAGTASALAVTVSGLPSLQAASTPAPANDLPLGSPLGRADAAVPGAVLLTVRVPTLQSNDRTAPGSLIASATSLPLTAALDSLFREKPGVRELSDPTSPSEELEAVRARCRSAMRERDSHPASKAGETAVGTCGWDGGWQDASPAMSPTEVEGWWDLPALNVDPRIGAEALALALAAACVFQPPEEAEPREPRRGLRLGARA
jgi:hypothetical protein